MPRTKTSNKTTTRTKRKKAESPKPAAKQRAPRRARNTRQQAAATAQAEQTERPPRSDKPERILAFLRKFMGENGYPPSVRDVVDGCKLSSTSVADYNLRILERQGHIRRDPERARTIVLTEPLEPAGGVAAVEPLRVPLLGAIAAGTRVVAPEGSDAKHADEHLQVTPDMLGGRDPSTLFAVTVRGDSMIDALIADGDTVIFEAGADGRKRPDGRVLAARRKHQHAEALLQGRRPGAAPARKPGHGAHPDRGGQPRDSGPGRVDPAPAELSQAAPRPLRGFLPAQE